MSFWGIVIGLVILILTCGVIKVTCAEPESCFLGTFLVCANILLGVLILLGCETVDTYMYFAIISLMNVGALIVGFGISFLIDEIAWECWEDVYPYVYSIIYLICIFVTFVVMNNQVNNIVKIETPDIVTNQYELMENEEFTSGEAEYSKLIYNSARGCYEFFYQTEDENGVLRIETYTVDSDEVNLVVQSGVETSDCDYLVEVVTTYYEEDRNKEPYERSVTTEEVERTLYLRKNTFDNMIIVGEGK